MLSSEKVGVRIAEGNKLTDRQMQVFVDYTVARMSEDEMVCSPRRHFVLQL